MASRRYSKDLPKKSSLRPPKLPFITPAIEDEFSARITREAAEAGLILDPRSRAFPRASDAGLLRENADKMREGSYNPADHIGAGVGTDFYKNIFGRICGDKEPLSPDMMSLQRLATGIHETFGHAYDTQKGLSDKLFEAHKNEFTQAFTRLPDGQRVETARALLMEAVPDLIAAYAIAGRFKDNPIVDDYLGKSVLFRKGNGIDDTMHDTSPMLAQFHKELSAVKFSADNKTLLQDAAKFTEEFLDKNAGLLAKNHNLSVDSAVRDYAYERKDVFMRPSQEGRDHVQTIKDSREQFCTPKPDSPRM